MRGEMDAPHTTGPGATPARRLAARPANECWQPIDSCRSCGSRALETVLEFGSLPLANALLTRDQLDQPEARFPLTLLFCRDCSLVQIRETVEPEVLFGHYLYFSSFSETMLAHAREEALTLARALHLGPKSLVVEIASNDGYLLKNFVELSIPVLGIEPATNIARVANERGIATRNEFFGLSLAQRLTAEGVRADLILANNVLAHVADLPGFLAGVALLLTPSGRAVFEFPYVADMLDKVEFDTIYHEHLCYFSLHAIAAACGRAGLRVCDVERFTIHGGSLRVHTVRSTNASAESAAVKALLKSELASGLSTSAPYQLFAQATRELCRALRAELQERKRNGQSIAAYGASAKGSTLLHAAGLGAETLDFVADRSSVKVGRLTPGNHLPILAPEALLERAPDAVLLLTWNFAEEIFRQQRAYLERGGTFLVPVPRLRCVGAEVLS